MWNKNITCTCRLHSSALSCSRKSSRSDSHNSVEIVKGHRRRQNTSVRMITLTSKVISLWLERFNSSPSSDPHRFLLKIHYIAPLFSLLECWGRSFLRRFQLVTSAFFVCRISRSVAFHTISSAILSHYPLNAKHSSESVNRPNSLSHHTTEDIILQTCDL